MAKYNAGDTFNDWTLIERLESKGTNCYGKFVCKCGEESITSIRNITSGRSKCCKKCSYGKRETFYTKHPNLYSRILELCASQQDIDVIVSIANDIYEEDSGVSVAKINPDDDLTVDNFFFSFNNRSGVFKSNIGIYLQDADKPSPLWVAKMLFPNESKRRSKAFSINKYGYEKAKELAENKRIEWVNEIIESNKKIAKEQGITELVAKYNGRVV